MIFDEGKYPVMWRKGIISTKFGIPFSLKTLEGLHYAAI
jgi:hypothetical protein